LGHLAVVPDVDPALAEDALHLQLEDLGVGVDRARHPVGEDQIIDAGAGGPRVQFGHRGVSVSGGSVSRAGGSSNAGTATSPTVRNVMLTGEPMAGAADGRA